MHSTTTQFNPIYALIADDLRAVETLFDQELQSDLPFIDELCRHVQRYRGKMLRPALTLLTAQACGGVRPEHITLAAVLEMVHMATLLHDDVLDDAIVRRRNRTVNDMTNNETAVLLGDYLISHAYHLCSSLESQYAARTIASCTNTVCEGELLQVGHRHNWDLNEDAYIDIVSRKTAALTSAACLLGAKYAGADAGVQSALESYGMDAGIAFQIVDDILDIAADESHIGKSSGRDLAHGELTLPLIHFLQTASAERVHRLKSECSNGGIDRSTLRVQLADSIDYAAGAAAQRVRAAVTSLDVLAPSPAADALRAMAEFIIQRAH